MSNILRNEEDVLTIDQMMQKFKDQWVLIADPEISPNTTRVVSGKVKASSPSRDDIDEALAQHTGKYAIEFMGSMGSNNDGYTMISYSFDTIS